jgi:nickel-dependent lactate racemase
MVALGTHPPLSEESLNKLVGTTAEERATKYKYIGLFNHSWDNPAALTTIGVMELDEIQAIAGERWHPSLPERVDIRLNRAALEYDHILILGPTFPHEVVGFSGGAKYLFPGISGPEVINATHWLGALAGVVGTIGLKETPVRAMIHAAARRLKTPVSLAALVVDGHDLAGIFVGDEFEAWSAAADLSAQRNLIWSDRPYRRVLSCAPAMYDELWTAAKAMYKLEPAVAVGGEVVIYAPHLDVVSHVHGKYIYEIGYHILPYFLQDWERFKHIPLGVLAHSTHVRGSGVVENGVEKPNVKVTLASKIPAEDCARLNLGYLDPATVNVDEWQGREVEGILVVPQAGEILYRVRP